MTPLDLFQFRARFASARSLAIVGNAPTILEHENGKLIDSHDIVVRFNRAQTRGLEEKIGGRTDILVANVSNTLAMAPSPSTTVRPKCVVAFVSPTAEADRFNPQAFYEWIGDLPLFLCMAPDFVGFDAPLHTRPFTSGTYTAYLLLRLLPIERLFLTGFTMFGQAPGGAGKYYADNRPGVGAYHDLDVEHGVFCDILGSYQGSFDATPEVLALLGRQRQRVAVHGGELRKRFAEGLSWRFLRWALKLRRYAEA